MRWQDHIELNPAIMVGKPVIKGTRLDPAYVWTKTRDVAPIAKQSFREWWKEHEQSHTR